MESAFRRGIYSSPSPSSTCSSPSSSSSSVEIYLLSNSINEGKYRTHHQIMMRKVVSPLSLVENLDISLVKVEEDVLVMDGILLSGGGGGRRLALDSSQASNMGKSYGGGVYRGGICRSWENFGTCRNSSKCQFAHGKEELHPTRITTRKTKAEAPLCKTYSTTGAYIYSSKCRFVHQMLAMSVIQVPSHSIRIDPLGRISSSSRVGIKNWSPMDDSITIYLPLPAAVEPPTREEIDAYIDKVLYGFGGSKRLAVFLEFSPHH